MQKDSRILYKWWDAFIFDVRMTTWGGKESKDREGRENRERAGESRQMPLSRQETSLMRCEIFICVGERKNSEPEGSAWDLREFEMRTTIHQNQRRHGTTRQNHNGKCIVRKHTLTNTNQEVRPTPPSDYITWPLCSNPRSGAGPDRYGAVC